MMIDYSKAHEIEIQPNQKVCKTCGESKLLQDFVPYYGEKRKEGLTRNVCRKCSSKKNTENIKNNPERKKKSKEYLRNYYKENKYLGKVKSYRTVDKKKELCSITINEFRELISLTPYCFYCSNNELSQLGLDRKDNLRGHSTDNVVVCCEKCNMILSDIPYEAKVLLSEGLKKINEQNLLKNWIIQTKRRKNA